MTAKRQDMSIEDQGCRYARNNGHFGKCIECPFPQCVHDIEDYLERSRNTEREWVSSPR